MQRVSQFEEQVQKKAIEILKIAQSIAKGDTDNNERVTRNPYPSNAVCNLAYLKKITKTISYGVTNHFLEISGENMADDISVNDKRSDVAIVQNVVALQG